jgi:hypothetical protein
MCKLAKMRRLDWHSRRHLQPTNARVGMRQREQAARNKILIRDRAVVVVTGSETGRPGGVPAGAEEECGDCRMQVRPDEDC